MNLNSHSSSIFFFFVSFRYACIHDSKESHTYHWIVANNLILVGLVLILVVLAERMESGGVDSTVSSLIMMDEDLHLHHQFSSTTKLHSNGPSATSVHELLECPVCTNSMYPPIHQVCSFFHFASWVGLHLAILGTLFLCLSLSPPPFFLRHDCVGKCAIAFRNYGLNFVLWILCLLEF